MDADRSGPTAARSDLDADDPIQRRAPYATNPFVGERGQRAQARILEATLQVFDEVGYHDCGIQRITEVSGSSRAAFYQYFSSKEDVFRHLAGRAAQRLVEVTESMADITPGAEGRDALRSWLGDFSAIYDDFEPIFMTFTSAAATDAEVADGAARIGVRTFEAIRSKVTGGEHSRARRNAIVRMLLDTVTRINRISRLTEASSMRPLGRDDINDAVADIFHRALYGAGAANVSTTPRRTGRAARPSPIAEPDDADAEANLGPAARRTRSLLIDRAHDVFIERGYHATRVADIVAAAEVSHGVFYRYFGNKSDIFERLALDASSRLSTALDDLPQLAGVEGEARTEAIEAWLTEYATTYADQSAIVGMWVEMMSRSQPLGTISRIALDHSRSVLTEFLAPRGFGDVDADAVVLVALLDAMAGQRPTKPRVANYAAFIEDGMLTPPS